MAMEASTVLEKRTFHLIKIKGVGVNVMEGICDEADTCCVLGQSAQTFR